MIQMPPERRRKVEAEVGGADFLEESLWDSSPKSDAACRRRKVEAEVGGADFLEESLWDSSPKSNAACRRQK